MGLFDYLAAIPVGMVIWMPIMAIALLFSTFFVYALLVARYIVFDGTKFLLFGLKPNDDITNFTTPSTFAHILIVSTAIWVIMFFLIIIKFSISEFRSSSALLRSAVKQSAISLLFLLGFQVGILLFNEFVINILKLIDGNEHGSTGLGFINRTFNPNFQEVIDEKPFEGSIVHSGNDANGYNFKWGIASIPGLWSVISAVHTKIPALILLSGGAIGYAIRGALFTFITVIFIYGSVLKTMLRNAGRIVPVVLLYFIFPIIVALSLADNGKKLRAWKDSFISNYLSLVLFFFSFYIINWAVENMIELIDYFLGFHSVIVSLIITIIGFRNLGTLQSVIMRFCGLPEAAPAQGGSIGKK